MDLDKKEFPEGMIPIGKDSFTFSCHPGVTCFTVCCHDVDLTLYPYDVLRLKAFLNMDSEDFVRKHTFLVRGDNPYFPTVKLKLTTDEKKACPFLKEQGCTVYDDRPSACRSYPLERAVDRSGKRSENQDFYFITNHPYCLGHKEEHEQTTAEWVRSQRLHDFNAMNDLWTEMDTLFCKNPWKGEGAGGEKQQLAFMVCYNIDGFRRFAEQHQLLKAFQLDKQFRRRIQKEDTALLQFGYEWLKMILGDKHSLIRK